MRSLRGCTTRTSGNSDDASHGHLGANRLLPSFVNSHSSGIAHQGQQNAERELVHAVVAERRLVESLLSAVVEMYDVKRMRRVGKGWGK